MASVNRVVGVKRVTALWALTETTFGGLLHALHIPLTGIFIGGAAIIFITLIAYFSEQKYSIIQATIIVLIIKGLVSPYTPIAAYFSVLLQGILAQLLFINKRHISLSAFVLSISTMLVFGFQKVIIYTIVFGNTLWQSLDTFANFIFDQFHFGGQNSRTIHFSLILISVYAFIHLVFGFFLGIMAGRIPGWITTSINEDDYFIKNLNEKVTPDTITDQNKNNKNFRKKKRVIIFFVVSLFILILSYFIPHSESNLYTNIVLMISRAIIITLVYYFYLAPIIINYLKKYLKKQQNVYAKEVQEIIMLIPHLKNILLHCWTKSSEQKGFRKYRLFFSYSIITMLLTNFNFE